MRINDVIGFISLCVQSSRMSNYFQKKGVDTSIEAYWSDMITITAKQHYGGDATAEGAVTDGRFDLALYHRESRSGTIIEVKMGEEDEKSLKVLEALKQIRDKKYVDYFISFCPDNVDVIAIVISRENRSMVASHKMSSDELNSASEEELIRIADATVEGEGGDAAGDVRQGDDPKTPKQTRTKCDNKASQLDQNRNHFFKRDPPVSDKKDRSKMKPRELFTPPKN